MKSFWKWVDYTRVCGHNRVCLVARMVCESKGDVLNQEVKRLMRRRKRKYEGSEG